LRKKLEEQRSHGRGGDFTARRPNMSKVGEKRGKVQRGRPKAICRGGANSVWRQEVLSKRQMKGTPKFKGNKDKNPSTACSIYEEGNRKLGKIGEPT